MGRVRGVGLLRTGLWQTAERLTLPSKVRPGGGGTQVDSPPSAPDLVKSQSGARGTRRSSAGSDAGLLDLSRAVLVIPTT